MSIARIGLVLLAAGGAHAFTHVAAVGRPTTIRRSAAAAPALSRMGIFDAIKKAFANQEFNDAPDTGASAQASHILFKGSEAKSDAVEVKAKIEAGELAFADAAKSFSQCPSRTKGGSLGRFKPGQMVPAFDKVVFDPEVPIGVITVVETNFGTHLVQVLART